MKNIHIQHQDSHEEFPFFKFRRGSDFLCFLDGVIVREKSIMPVYNHLLVAWKTRDQVVMSSKNHLLILERRWPFVHLRSRTEESDEE